MAIGSTDGRGERKLEASKSEQQILALPSDEGQHWTVVTSLEERGRGSPAVPLLEDPTTG